MDSDGFRWIEMDSDFTSIEINRLNWFEMD